MKKLFIISISAILGMFTQIDSSYAAGNCGIGSLDTSTDGMGTSYYGYTRLNGNTGYNESNHGLTPGSGQWAVQFSYGTIWGMANCNSTSGTYAVAGTPTLASSGLKCWCQATGFTASGNSYTSGPQCTTTASSLWVFAYDHGSSDHCALYCVAYCAYYVQASAEFRAGMFGAVPQTVDLTWYDNGTTISGASSCTVGGTFVPPTPPARPGYIFTGWRVKEKCGINNLDTSIAGTAHGYTRLSGSAGSNESNYGLTRGSGQWATEFSYGTIWGMAKCSSTSGNNGSYTWPESSKSNWLKTPSDTNGRYCWCQATGFTASGNSYTSGPQCTTTASSLWVFDYDYGSSGNCASDCAYYCARNVRSDAAFRAGVFGAVGQ